MPITPDLKDWTWVLERPCPECGFDSRDFPADRVPSLIRDNAALWHDLLTTGTDLSQRPDDSTWSPLEYACHVRDVFDLYDVRLHLMLDHDAPEFPNWDQDESAVERDYNAQDPADVARDLSAAAGRLADSFETVDGDQWQRTGTRSDGATFTIDTFARYLIHDPVHHWHDVAP